jgi:hypothetical protein
MLIKETEYYISPNGLTICLRWPVGMMVNNKDKQCIARIMDSADEDQTAEEWGVKFQVGKWYAYGASILGSVSVWVCENEEMRARIRTRLNYK